jgi:hypothetical protein
MRGRGENKWGLTKTDANRGAYVALLFDAI